MTTGKGACEDKEGKSLQGNVVTDNVRIIGRKNALTIRYRTLQYPKPKFFQETLGIRLKMLNY